MNKGYSLDFDWFHYDKFNVIILSWHAQRLFYHLEYSINTYAQVTADLAIQLSYVN